MHSTSINTLYAAPHSKYRPFSHVKKMLGGEKKKKKTSRQTLGGNSKYTKSPKSAINEDQHIKDKQNLKLLEKIKIPNILF